MYIVHIMNLKINIWISSFQYDFLKFLVLFKNICLSIKFKLWKVYLNIKIDVSILKIATGIHFIYI
jgi:hypothetical protein